MLIQGAITHRRAAAYIGGMDAFCDWGAGMARKKKRNGFRVLEDWIAASLDLPPDLTEAIPRVFWLGRDQVHIDNHRGVSLFLPERIRLETGQGPMEVCGNNMSMSKLSATQVEICGEITSIAFVTKTKA